VRQFRSSLSVTPWQEFVDARGLVIRDAAQRAGQPRPRIDNARTSVALVSSQTARFEGQLPGIGLRLFGFGAGFSDLGAEFRKFQACFLKFDLFQLSIRVGIHNPYERSVPLVRCLLFFFLAVLPIETAECDFRRPVSVFSYEFTCSHV